MRQPAKPAGAGPIPVRTGAPARQLGAVDLVQCGGRNLEHDLLARALTELVGEYGEMVEQTVAARMHHREGGRIVLDRPQTRTPRGRDQEVRSARAFGGLVAKVARVQLHSLVRQRRRECQLEGPRIRKQGLR